MKPNEVRKMIDNLNSLLKYKLEIVSNRADGTFTVKMKHHSRVLNVEKNSKGEYFIKWFPFLDMSEGHCWAVRESRYASFLTETALAITKTQWFGLQADKYVNNHNLGSYRNTETALGIFMLAPLCESEVATMTILTIIAQREQIEMAKELNRKKKEAKKQRIEEGEKQVYDAFKMWNNVISKQLSGLL